MSAWFVSMGLVAALLSQVESGAPHATADEAIARAISDLGDAKFSVRRRASKALWQQGLAAEPALREAAGSIDREIRIRAQHLLNDFAYGILPGVPADIVALIRQFRDGPPNGRSAVLQHLADRDCFETIQRLIQLEPDPNTRRQLLVTWMQNPQAVERYFEPERMEKLVVSVGADLEEVWRRTVFAQLMFSSKVIQRLAEKGRLDVLPKIVDREESADIRRQMLSMLFQNSPAVTSLIENDQLPFVLQVIEKEPDEKTRDTWVSQLLTMSGVMQQLASDDRLEDLLEFAQDNVGAEQRSRILQEMFRNSMVLKAILEECGVERLIALTSMEKDAAARGAILAALVSSTAVREQLTETGQKKLALKLARQEKDATTRSEYLKGILTSVISYSLIRDEDNRNALWALIKADSGTRGADATDWRGVAILRILTMSSGNEVLRDETESAWLMQFLRDDMSPDDRVSIVERLVADYRLRKSLLEHKHFDALLALVKQLPASRRGRVMGQLFSAMGQVEPFGGEGDASRVELMVSLARQETDERARRQFLQSLFQNSSAMSALVAGGFYDDLWSLIVAEKDALEHAILRGEFLRSSSVVQTIREKKQLDGLLDFAQQAEDADVRHEYLKRLFGSQDAMSALIDKGHYDALYALANDDGDSQVRVQLLCQFYGNSEVVEQLIKKEQVGILLDFAEEHAGDKRTTSYLQQLFFNSNAVSALVALGRIDSMLSLARRTQDKYRKASLMRSVFGAPQVIKHFADNDQLSEMCAMINAEEAEVRYQVYYNMTIRSETVAVFVESDWILEFLDMLKTQIDPKRQGQLLGRVVVQTQVVDFLADNNQLNTIIRLASDLENSSARQQYLGSLFPSVEVVGLLIDRGYFEVLHQLASSDTNPGMRTRLRVALLTNSKTVEHLVAEKKTSLLLDLVDEQTDGATRHSISSSIASSPNAVAALIEQGKFERLVQICRSVEDPDSRRRMLAELLLSDKAIEQLAATDALNPVVQEVLGETKPSNREKLLQRLFSLPEATGALVKHGQFERLLEEHSDSDLGRLRLATCLLVTGQIDARIHQVRQRLEPAVNVETEEQTENGAADNDRRLLIYLLRVQGDLAAACEEAETLGDPGLLKAMCVEAGRWTRAAELYQADACPLPIPTSHVPSEDRNQLQVEQLGLVAAYQRLGGDGEACDQTLSQIRQLSSSHPDDTSLQWLCVEALLLNGDVEHGLNLVAKSHPSRAFDLYALRHEYDLALKLAGWNEDTQCDRKWLESLPVEKGDANAVLLARTGFALQVARLLYALGMSNHAHRIVALLDDYLDDLPAGDSTAASARRQCRERLVAALLDMDDEQGAWKLAAKTFQGSDSSTGLLSCLFSRQYVEARGWWLFFRERHSVESPAMTLSRVHGVLRPAPKDGSEAWPTLVDQVLQAAESSAEANRQYTLLGVGQTCLRREDFARALRCTELLTEEDDTDVLLLRAQALRGSQRWADAAEAFHALWQVDHSNLSALYLSGDALQREGGHQTEAQQRKSQSLSMALDSRARLRIALDLMRYGLREESTAQLRLVLRTAPFEHPEWNEAARHLGEELQESDPVRAAELLEYSLLDDLRTWFHLLNERDYLRTPAKIHCLRAAVAIDAREFSTADREIQRALTALPGDIDLAQQVVPQWEQAGQQEQADALFDQVFQAYALPMQQNPDSGLLNNDSAWLLARCDRRLDEALRRAEKAVDLAPNNASYLDTLAEVRFRMGDRDSALRYSRRAVDLRPGYEPLREQLQRFQDAPLPDFTRSGANFE